MSGFYFLALFLNVFFNVYLSERERERERERACKQERDREKRDRNLGRLHTVKAEPDAGLKPTNHEIMT